MPGEKPEDFTLDRVWELLEPWVGPEDVEVLRYPVYQFRESMTDEWRRDRIFLIGDAAHILWPFAGEGMCNGLRDASASRPGASTWCCAAWPTPRVLDTYEADRKPNMQGWIDLSREIGLPCVVTDPEAAAQRDGFLKAVQQDPSPDAAARRSPARRRSPPPATRSPERPRVQGRSARGDRSACSTTWSGKGFQLIATDPSVLDVARRGQPRVRRSHRRRRRRRRRRRPGAPVIDVDGTYAQLVRPTTAAPRSWSDRTSTCSASAADPADVNACARLSWPQALPAAADPAAGYWIGATRTHPGSPLRSNPTVNVKTGEPREHQQAPPPTPSPQWKAAAEAHKRAMPLQRLTGNGMDYADVIALYASSTTGLPWARTPQSARRRANAGTGPAGGCGRAPAHRPVAGCLRRPCCYRVGQVVLEDGQQEALTVREDDRPLRRGRRALADPPVEHSHIAYRGGRARRLAGPPAPAGP